jgi:hypothetical protein
VAVGLALVVVAPVLVAGLNGVARVWFPAGDWAVIETRVLDVGGAHTPLVGPYSRDGWNHPGPLLFWLLAVPYRLSGGHPSSMLLGAALVNAAAVVAILVFAWRRGGLALFAPMAVVLALLLHTIGPALLRDPWNPWVTAVPFGLLIVVAWAATEGDRAALPVVAVVGAFTAQSHLAFLPFAAILTLAAGVGFWLRERRARPLLIGAGVAVVCWLPVLTEVVTGGPNTGDRLSYFRAAGDTAGWRASERVASLELGLPAPWLGAPEPANAAGGGLVGAGLRTLTVPLVLFGAALAVAWWARARPAVRFQLFLAGTAVVGLVSVSRMTGDIFNYLVRWWWALAALMAASVGWSLACGVRRLAMGRVRAQTVIRAGAMAVAAVVVVYTSISTIRSAGERLPVDDWTPALVDVAAPGADHVPHDRPVYVQATGPLAGWVGDAIAPRLVAAGVDVRVPDVGINRHKWGSFRVVPGPDASMRGAWMVTGSRIQDFRDARVGTEVASYDPLSPAERLDSTQLERQLRAAYTAAGRQDLVERMDEGVSLWTEAPVPGVDQGVLDRYEAYRRRGVSVALFLTDDATTPAPPRPT